MPFFPDGRHGILRAAMNLERVITELYASMCFEAGQRPTGGVTSSSSPPARAWCA